MKMKFTKKSKKILVVALIAVFVVCAVPVGQMIGVDFGLFNVDAASILYSGSVNSAVNWSLDSNYELTISGSGAMTDYTSSDSSPWQSYKEDILSVVVEDGVTTVGDMAFYGCENLVSVVVGDSVTTIGEDAFCDNVSLEDVNLGEAVQTIQAGAFAWCSELYSITLPEVLVSIEENAFYDCDSIYIIFYGGYDWADVEIHSNGNTGLESAIIDYKLRVDQVVCTTYTSEYDSITINWNEVDEAVGYRVYLEVDGSYITLKTIGSGTTTTYTATGLDANTEYSFKVKAYVRDDSGTAIFGEASEEYVASTKTSQVVMTTYSCTYDAIRINWEEVEGADGYRVYQLINGTYTNVSTISGGDITTLRLDGYDANTLYSFKVKAYVRNDAGTAIWLDASEEYAASTKTSQVSMTTYSCTFDAIRINWSATTSADGYRIYVLLGDTWTTVETVSSSTLTYRLDGFDANTEYVFKVKAYIRNDAGTAIWLDASDEYVASTKTGQVSITSSSCTSTAIRVNWDLISGADGYRVYALIDGKWVNQGTISSTTTTLRMSGFEAGTTYTFKVNAYVRNDDGTAIWLDDGVEYQASTK